MLQDNSLKAQMRYCVGTELGGGPACTMSDNLVFDPNARDKEFPFITADDAKVKLLGRQFLDAFIGGPSEVAQQNYTYGPLEEDSMEMSPMEAEAMRRFLKSPEMQERIRRVREKFNLNSVRGV